MSEKSALSFTEIQDDPFWSNRLSTLFTFLEIARHRSIRAAAKEMYVSPQSLNKQLAKLEKKFGVPLIQRSTRGFSLTRYGEEVYRCTSEMLDDLQELRRDLATMYADESNLLRVGLAENLYDTVLHMYMMDFQPDDPHCKMKLARGHFDQIMEIANGNEPHIVVTTMPAITDQFEVTVLHDAKYYFLAHKENDLSEMESAGISDLLDTQLILCTELFRSNQYLLKYCTEKNVSISVHLETGGFYAGVEKCRRNKGVMLITDYIEDLIDIENFVKIRPKKGLFDLEIVMLTRKDLVYSHMEEKFIEYMRAYTSG